MKTEVSVNKCLLPMLKCMPIAEVVNWGEFVEINNEKSKSNYSIIKVHGKLYLSAITVHSATFHRTFLTIWHPLQNNGQTQLAMLMFPPQLNSQH